MKQYTADRQAQRVLQAATPMAAAILLFLIWYFLAILPDWLLWTLTGLLLLAAILIAVLLIPMWFNTVSYTVSATHITKRCGIIPCGHRRCNTVPFCVRRSPRRRG